MDRNRDSNVSSWMRNNELEKGKWRLQHLSLYCIKEHACYIDNILIVFKIQAPIDAVVTDREIFTRRMSRLNTKHTHINTHVSNLRAQSLFIVRRISATWDMLRIPVRLAEKKKGEDYVGILFNGWINSSTLFVTDLIVARLSLYISVVGLTEPSASPSDIFHHTRQSSAHQRAIFFFFFKWPRQVVFSYVRSALDFRPNFECPLLFSVSACERQTIKK